MNILIISKGGAMQYQEEAYVNWNELFVKQSPKIINISNEVYNREKYLSVGFSIGSKNRVLFRLADSKRSRQIILKRS